MQDGISLAPLLRLPELRQLHVHGVQQQADGDVLAQLTGLTALKVCSEGDAVGPQHLAAFSRFSLSSCYVWNDKERLVGFGPYLW